MTKEELERKSDTEGLTAVEVTEYVHTGTIAAAITAQVEGLK